MICDMCANDITVDGEQHVGYVWNVPVNCCSLACYEQLEIVWEPAQQHLFRDTFLITTIIMSIIMFGIPLL